MPIRAVVTTIGKICLEFQGRSDWESRKFGATALMAEDRNKLDQFLEHLTAPDSHDQHIMLLYGILKIYAELMTSETWACSQSTLVKLVAKVRKQLEQKERRPLLYFDKGLLMHLCLVDTFYPLVSFEDSFLGDLELYDPSWFENVDSLTGEVRINSAILHHYTKFMAHFVRLRRRAFIWVREARGVLNDKHLTGEASEGESKEIIIAAGLMQKGKEVVTSSAAAIEAMENLRDGRYNNGEDNDSEGKRTDFYTLRGAYYTYALMALTRTFSDPVWKFVDKDLPRFINLSDFEARGEVLCERIARRMSVVGMEAWSYLPLIGAAGFESRTPKNRERVKELVNDIIGKGFTTAELCLADVKMLWRHDCRLAAQTVPGQVS
ncbi:hypothetical protein LY78DRAFT_691164 [Colletotrichum sublineola]|nr:hypothetical protein LY78DRAFT_691164 [Colletotrichum sublineola]